MTAAHQKFDATNCVASAPPKALKLVPHVSDLPLASNLQQKHWIEFVRCFIQGLLLFIWDISMVDSPERFASSHSPLSERTPFSRTPTIEKAGHAKEGVQK